MEITARELEKLIELRKRKAELDFKKNIFSVDNKDELEKIEKSIKTLEESAKAAKVRIIFPNQNTIDELNGKLKQTNAEEIKKAITSENGDAYSTLIQKGEIIKKNYMNRLEIAKLSIVISDLDVIEKQAIVDAVQNGKITGTLSVDSLSEIDRQILVKFLRRCGIECKLSENLLGADDCSEENEFSFEIQKKRIWVDKETKEKLENNLKKIEELNAPIQLKNAERHVKVFSEEEETEFNALQHEYLELLKEQDELLKEFDKECEISVKR